MNSTQAAAGPTETAADASRRHLADTVRVWVGATDSSIALPPLPERLARLLERLEEYERPERDRWGIWGFESSGGLRPVPRARPAARLPGRPAPPRGLERAATGLARRSGAGTLRFQPWPSAAGNGQLRRACRLLGFVARSDFTTLYVRARDETLTRPGAVAPTPLLYLSF